MGDLVALPAYQRCSTAEHSVGKPDLAMGLGGGHVALIAFEGFQRHLKVGTHGQICLLYQVNWRFVFVGSDKLMYEK